ncbi:MAG: tol-pal system protein YbgF [Kangiellaceae bacterium]|jgi:tol-pal system protein YbgF|nr:tol-pal system protein YbgF [Kangiellaceae bacterium]
MSNKLVSNLLNTALITVLYLVSGPANSAQSVEERLQRLEQMAESRGQLQADIMFKLNSLQEELQKLRGNSEEQGYQLKQVQDRQRDLYSDIERRLTKLQALAAAVDDAGINASGLSTNANTQVFTSPTGPSANANTAVPPTSASQGNELDQYNKVFAMVRNRQYPEAISGFTNFLQRYPNGKYAANAHYWLGQVYYVTSDFDSAEVQFKELVTRHADSLKAPDGMLKLGSIYEKKAMWQQAQQYYQQVFDNYEGTPKQLAQIGLRRVKQQLN